MARNSTFQWEKYHEMLGVLAGEAVPTGDNPRLLHRARSLGVGFSRRKAEKTPFIAYWSNSLASID